MNNNAPTILCHPACSGGSLIFRMIISQFDLVGLSEMSHQHDLPPGTFMPTDPEYSLLLSGVITETEYAEIFMRRVVNSIEICQARDLQPLIREHTHSYFFSPTFAQNHPSNPSWIATEYEKKFAKRLKCIISTRDPVDSWLGLKAHFPSVAPINFDQYARYYLDFIDTLELNNEPTKDLLIRYEDVILQAEEELRRIAKFLDIPFDGEVNSGWNNVISTGNSGRQSEKLELRPRRPFDIEFMREAENSDAYADLIEKLDYDHISETSSRGEVLSARLLPLERKARLGTGFPIRKLRSWLLRKKNRAG